MTNTTHTPGPWHRNIKANGKYPVVFSGRNNHIATVTQQANPEETEANIDLIAAAADLLKQLEWALDVIEYNRLNVDATDARLAVRAAKGGQQ